MVRSHCADKAPLGVFQTGAPAWLEDATALLIFAIVVSTFLPLNIASANLLPIFRSTFEPGIDGSPSTDSSASCIIVTRAFGDQFMDSQNHALTHAHTRFARSRVTFTAFTVVFQSTEHFVYIVYVRNEIAL